MTVDGLAGRQYLLWRAVAYADGMTHDGDQSLRSEECGLFCSLFIPDFRLI